jgi:aspartate racemase
VHGSRVKTDDFRKLTMTDLPRIGVLGGMGPLASAEFMVKLVCATPARFDQEHYPTTLDATPQIPDRPSALDGRGPDPMPAMVAVLRRLEQAGCAMVTMPCNTVHHWYDRLQAQTRLPMVHIADAVAAALRAQVPKAKRVGVLGSTVTSRLGIYSNRLGSEWQWVYASEDELARLVMPAIAAIKAGDLSTGRRQFIEAAHRLVERGLDALVFACTEIPVVLTATDVPVPVIDSMEALAIHTVRFAQGLHCLPNSEQIHESF